MEISEEDKQMLILKDKCQLVINKTERPNSYETGKAGNRLKIYFDDAADLTKQTEALEKAGFYTKK